ncbi:4'-phosphopantetheinyl transferase superfamily protein [Acinetobacter sp. S40]|uniref:4'-phosphopantetheinyl transferase family protein n=1 Tax=Acinetobacter sp. S40 TaxID=2767434 RepID=UPI00190CC25F|nr:4'-phosphopantetheinyl transferase superfamily protein [Acinetobacter sp. S40]MBJ9986755.1 4'-phosphopantetheinyl transferase superfamily protein [Acinetobacter sp. S40]
MIQPSQPLILSPLKSSISLQQHARLLFRDEHLQCSLLHIHGQSIHQVRLLNMNEHTLDHYYFKFNIFIPFHIARASLKRKCEFFIGRLAAKFALASLGNYALFIIKKGQYGEPLWPKRITGSISHSMLDCTHGIAIATAAINTPNFNHDDGINHDNQNYKNILGIDVEIKQNADIFKEYPSMLNSLMSPQEAKLLSPFLDQVPTLYLILFSAKESLIKALYNKYQQLIPFNAMHCIGFNTETCTLSFYLPQTSPKMAMNRTIQVKYLELEDEIMTFCSLEASTNKL